MGYYLSQRQGKELINDSENISDGKVWRSAYSKRSLYMGKIPLLETVISSTHGQKRLVWYWYDVSGYATNSDFFAKLLQLWGQITKQRFAAIVAVAIDYDDSIQNARAELQNLLETMSSPIQRLLVDLKTEAIKTE
jgi:EpsI family protein